MATRVYLKQLKDRQTIFVVTSSEVFRGERFFDGYQFTRKGTWMEWDMTEKHLNKMVEDGRMVRIQ